MKFKLSCGAASHIKHSVESQIKCSQDVRNNDLT